MEGEHVDCWSDLETTEALFLRDARQDITPLFAIETGPQRFLYD